MTESVSTGTSSSIMKNLQKPWVIGTIALVAAGVAYAVAFDARRRLDPKFRKQLQGRTLYLLFSADTLDPANFFLIHVLKRNANK
ncbi:hypothetical protein HMI54_014426 [Coelomomyces lativittatus]|nr:hypothetical protein HMI54_014426 [Coelomomyces lativittatus]